MGLQPSRSREAHWSFDKDLEGVRSLGAALVDASLFGRKGMSERAKNLEGEAVAPPGASRTPSKGTMFASITRASQATPLLIAEPQQNHRRAIV